MDDQTIVDLVGKLRGLVQLPLLREMLEKAVEASQIQFDDLALDMFYKFVESDELYDLFINVLKMILKGENDVDIWTTASANPNFQTAYAGVGKADLSGSFMSVLVIIKIAVQLAKLFL